MVTGYRTMVDIAFDRVRDAILSGEFEPGEKVPQDAIAAELSISRMPLREALRQLEARGFVTMVPHRGAIVTALSSEAVKEIYLIRTTLESVSAGLAARQMDSGRIKRLEALLTDARDALAAGDVLGLAEANRNFHLVGHEATQFPMLNRMIHELSDHSHRYRLLHGTLGERAQAALDEHDQILRAWAERDGDGAAYWIRVNLMNSEAALLQAFAASGDGGAQPSSASAAQLDN